MRSGYIGAQRVYLPSTGTATSGPAFQNSGPSVGSRGVGAPTTAVPMGSIGGAGSPGNGLGATGTSVGTALGSSSRLPPDPSIAPFPSQRGSYSQPGATGGGQFRGVSQGFEPRDSFSASLSNPLPGTSFANSVPAASSGPAGTDVPPNWDPFAPPGSLPPPGLSSQPSAGIFPAIGETWNQARRFLEVVSVDAVWMPGDGAKELGLTDIELTASFSIPLRDLRWPVLVTPGFAFQFWNGPEGPPYELPPRTYEAFLDAQWHPQLSEIVGAELGVRVGVYSDFEEWVEECLRIQGRGLGVITLSPDLKLKLGAWYLDRNRINLLPAGGLVWTPTSDARIEAVFPNPRIALRLPGYSTVEWWFYFRGEYGGDAWTVDLDTPGYGPHPYEIDYNDIRIGLGVEFTTVRQLRGLLEIGGAVGREVLYIEPIGQPPIPTFRPSSTVFFRGAVAY
jgi:hypothetical protein